MSAHAGRFAGQGTNQLVEAHAARPFGHQCEHDVAAFVVRETARRLLDTIAQTCHAVQVPPRASSVW